MNKKLTTLSLLFLISSSVANPITKTTQAIILPPIKALAVRTPQITALTVQKNPCKAITILSNQTGSTHTMNILCCAITGIITGYCLTVYQDANCS